MTDWGWNLCYDRAKLADPASKFDVEIEIVVGKMQKETAIGEIVDSELEILRRRVKHLEAEIQTLRSRQEVLDRTEIPGSLGELSLLVGIEEGLAVLDSDWRIVLSNGNAELLLRKASGSLRGKQLWSEFPELIGTPAELAFRRSMSGRINETTEAYYESISSWLQWRIYPAPPDGVLIFFNNVTERRMAEAALRRSEERWRTLADAIPLFVWVSKSFGDTQFVNAYFYEYTGLPKGQTDLSAIQSAVHPDDVKTIDGMWREALAERREKTFEYRVRRADGTYRWHHGTHRPERDSSGEIIRWVGCGVDIHDVKAAREELRELAERQQLAIFAGGVGLWDWEIEADRVTWSEQLCKVLGLTPGSISGTLTTFTDLIHREDCQRVRGEIKEALVSGRFEATEFRMIRPTSEIRWVTMRAQVVCDAAGSPTRMLGAIIDITERKSAEAKLARQVAQFETLFRELPVGAAVAYDRQCDVIRINPAFAAMLGIAPDTNASKNEPARDDLKFRVMQGDKEVPPEDLPMQIAARTGREVRNFTYDLVRADGTRLREFGNAVPLTDEYGKIVGSIGVFVDLAEIERARLKGADQ